MNTTITRSRWAAIGAAVAVTLGAGGIGLVSATSPADAVAYVPIEPCRITDTRAGEFNTGPRNTPIGQNETLAITAHGDNGQCVGIPTTATGLQLNVTSLSATNGTFLTVWGTGDRPTVSSLNPQPNQPPIPNAVTTGVTATGVFNIYNAVGTVDVIVDIVGYYTDHNHDDRYYTETETDAALATKANTADVYAKTESNQRYDNVEAAGDSAASNVLGFEPFVKIMATITIDAPAVGFITAMASTSVHAPGGARGVRCAITTGSTIDDNNFEADIATDGRATLAGTRTIPVSFLPVSGEITVNLVCTSGGYTTLWGYSNISAIFTPDPDAALTRRPRVGP